MRHSVISECAEPTLHGYGNAYVETVDEEVIRMFTQYHDKAKQIEVEEHGFRQLNRPADNNEYRLKIVASDLMTFRSLAGDIEVVFIEPEVEEAPPESRYVGGLIANNYLVGENGTVIKIRVSWWR